MWIDVAYLFRRFLGSFVKSILGWWIHATVIYQGLIVSYRACHSLPFELLERGFPPKMYLDTGLPAKIHIVYQVIILKCKKSYPRVETYFRLWKQCPLSFAILPRAQENEWKLSPMRFGASDPESWPPRHGKGPGPKSLCCMFKEQSCTQDIRSKLLTSMQSSLLFHRFYLLKVIIQRMEYWSGRLVSLVKNSHCSQKNAMLISWSMGLTSHCRYHAPSQSVCGPAQDMLPQASSGSWSHSIKTTRFRGPHSQITRGKRTHPSNIIFHFMVYATLWFRWSNKTYEIYCNIHRTLVYPRASNWYNT